MTCPCRDPHCPLASIGWALCQRCDRHHRDDRECPKE